MGIKGFVLGTVLGVTFSTGLGLAGNLYDNGGNVRAPHGSQQSFDYFRQRGAYLDLQQLRNLADQQNRGRAVVPCQR